MILYIIFSISLLLISLILIGIREGLVIKDLLDNKTSSKESRQWHMIGFIIRSCQILTITFLTLILGFYWIVIIFTTLAILISAIWYNIIINLINGWKWYYLGASSKLDIKLGKFILWVKEKIKLK